MAHFRIKRDACTSKGFVRRLDDLKLNTVADPRDARWTRFPLLGVLKLALMSMVSGGLSQRAFENRSESIGDKFQDYVGLTERMSDNAWGALLRRLDVRDLRYCLQLAVKAEYERKALVPTQLPWSTVSIDGKHLATLSEERLRRLVTGDSDKPLSVEELRAQMKVKYPWVQVCEQESLVYGLIRVHNVALVSAAATMVLDQREIPGHSNEVGTIQSTVQALVDMYGKTSMVQLVMTDAGNTRCATGEFLTGKKVDYLFTIADNHPDIFNEARSLLGARTNDQAEATLSENTDGLSVVHSVWTTPLPAGFLRWSHARQLIRVERVCANNKGEITVGNRYYATSMTPDKASPENLLQASRVHWRIENEVHWTSDVVFREDARRTPLSKHPTAILVVAMLRTMARNILAMLRSKSRFQEAPACGERRDPNQPERWCAPSWRHVLESLLQMLFVPLLDTTAFDLVDPA
jgi:predicted transposase YbfD/YdcC